MYSYSLPCPYVVLNKYHIANRTRLLTPQAKVRPNTYLALQPIQNSNKPLPREFVPEILKSSHKQFDSVNKNYRN